MLPLTVSHMRLEDLGEVLELEKEAFACPWSRNMYLGEMRKEEGYYLVARAGGVLAGYGGVLIILDEAHVMTLAVREAMRRRGVAMRIMLELIRGAESMGVRFLTLEVRKSNHAAIALYKKLGFQVMGERKNYYLDNYENALIMWTEDITAPEYRENLSVLWRRYAHAYW